LLILDEPVAALDPLARRAFLRDLLEFVAELEVSVVLSSHLLGDLERVCDHLVVLASSRVQLAGDVEDLLAVHYRLTGAREDFDDLPAGVEIIQAEYTAGQSSLIVHATDPIRRPTLHPEQIDLEDLVLAYMTRAATTSVSGFSAKPLEAQR